MILNLDPDLDFYLLFIPCFENTSLGFTGSLCLEEIGLHQQAITGYQDKYRKRDLQMKHKMYTELNIYIKQMTSSECPLRRAFIEVASGVSRKGSFDSG